MVRPIDRPYITILAPDAARETPTTNASIDVAIDSKKMVANESLVAEHASGAQLPYGLENHLTADERENNQRNNARIGLDDRRYQGSAKIPRNRHSGLEDGKGDGHGDLL